MVLTLTVATHFTHSSCYQRCDYFGEQVIYNLLIYFLYVDSLLTFTYILGKWMRV